MRPVEGAVHQAHHFLGVADRGDRHIRQRTHDGDVLDRQVGGPERGIDQAAAIGDQPHRQIVQAQIHSHLLVAAPRDEGGDRVDVGNVSFGSETGGHADHVGFGDAFHVVAVGHVPLHVGQQAGAQIGSNEQHALVALGQIVDHVETGLTHDLLQLGEELGHHVLADLRFVMPGCVVLGE